MITDFEDFTQRLSQDEMVLLKPLMHGFTNHDKDNPITSEDIVTAINRYCEEKGIKIKMTGVKLRKYVNYIRSNALLPLIATSKGYFVSKDKAQITKQIESLEQRARSIQQCADKMRTSFL